MKDSTNTSSTIKVEVKRILVPIDRSECKEKIAAYALSLTKAWRAEMTAIHVIEPKQALPNGGEVYANEKTRIDKSVKQTENLLNEIDFLTKKNGMNVRKEALEESGVVGKTIIEYAKINNFDVIVIGTKGMSAVEEYFFGSVANKVI